jgi:hypothetical protein
MRLARPFIDCVGGINRICGVVRLATFPKSFDDEGGMIVPPGDMGKQILATGPAATRRARISTR